MLQNGGGAVAAAPEGLIKETTTQGFVKDVIEESKRQPVLIDFWAPWCGPCKQLTPVLEKVVKAAKGKVKLVKMNIDEHPAIPGQMGIQSIPAVIAFVNGQPADGFLGALPEGQVLAFIERLTKDKIGGEEKDLLKAAEAALARQRFRRRGRSLCPGAGAGRHQHRSARRSRALLCRHRRARPGQADARHGAGGQTQRCGGRGRARGDRARRAVEVARPDQPSSSRRSPPIRSIIRRASISRSRSTPRASAQTRSII